MAHPSPLLQRLPASWVQAALSREAPVLPLGVPAVDTLLPGGGIVRGGVTEFEVQGGAAGATRLALLGLRALHEASRQQGRELPWCAFIDPTCTLYAPGVARSGVALERLLVVRPPEEELARTVLRLAEAQAFAALVVDLVGIPGAPSSPRLAHWPKVVRRLSQLTAQSGGVALLMTSAEAPRPVPLPVAQRITLRRLTQHRLSLQITKDRLGRLTPPLELSWAALQAETGPGVASTGARPSEPAAPHWAALMG